MTFLISFDVDETPYIRSRIMQYVEDIDKKFSQQSKASGSNIEDVPSEMNETMQPPAFMPHNDQEIFNKSSQHSKTSNDFRSPSNDSVNGSLVAQAPFQLKKKPDGKSDSYLSVLKRKLLLSLNVLEQKRARYLFLEFHKKDDNKLSEVTSHVDKFITHGNDLLTYREWNEKFDTGEVGSVTKFLKEFSSVATKFTHATDFLAKSISGDPSSMDSTLDSFESFLTFSKDFIPDVPIAKRYLNFIYDGGIKAIQAIRKIKDKIIEVNALSIHINGDDMYRSLGSNGQEMLNYLNQEAYRKSSPKEMEEIPPKVKAFVYDNFDRLEEHVGGHKNELPPDDSYIPWTSYEEDKLREWIFKNRETIHQKFTGKIRKS